MSLIEFGRWGDSLFFQRLLQKSGPVAMCVESVCEQSVVVESKISWAMTTFSTLGNTCSLEVCEEWETPFCGGENASPL